MGEAFINSTIKKGLKLNDVIEEFRYVYKGQNIKAGDFVNYINGVASKNDYGESVDTQLSTTSYSGNIISAVQLDENRIFIAHQMPSDIDSTSSLYGMIVTINGVTISSGEDTLLVSGKYSGHEFSATLLGNGNIFIAYMYYTGSNYQVYGMVCSATGTTITILTNSQAINASYSSAFSEIKVCVLSSNKIFIAYGAYTNSYLYCSTCSISDTTITKGNALQLSTQTKSGIQISTCLLPNGNIFIAHSYGTSYHLYGIVCTISGTTITAGSDTAIRAKYRAGQFISAVLLNGSQNSIFIAHSDDSSEVDYLYLYGTLVTINGTTINVVVSKSLATRDTGYCVKALRLDENRVAIFHNYNSSSFPLGGVIAVITNNSITPTTDIQLSTASYSGRVIQALLLDNNTIFVAHTYNSSYYLYSQIFAIDYDNNIPTNNIVITEYEQQVTPAIETSFDAIALSGGVGGTDTEHNEQVKIARVYKEVEKTFTGNVFPTSWNEEVAYTKYSSDDGYVIEANTTQMKEFSPDKAFNGTLGSGSRYGSQTGHNRNEWLMITCPEPAKITKMNIATMVYCDTTDYKVTVQGSKNKIDWFELAEITTFSHENLSEIELFNTDLYTYYKIDVNSPTTGVSFYVDEWQTSEYIVKEVIQ